MNIPFVDDSGAELMPRLPTINGAESGAFDRLGHKVYLLLATIVLVLLFAASYGGRSTWVSLASATLSASLVFGLAFIANAKNASPYFVSLAAQTPALISFVAQDLAIAAEHTAAARARPQDSIPTEAAAPPQTARASESDENAGWLSSATSWLNPWNWFSEGESGEPEVKLQVQDDTTRSTTPSPQTPDAPMPTVRSMMQPQDETVQNSAATSPSYRIVTAPPVGTAPVTASPPSSPGAPVEWIEGVAAPAGMSRVLLSGTNTSNAQLEDIQATLRPDSGPESSDAANVALSLLIENQDGTAIPGTSIPPGTRFHLQAEGLSEDATEKLGGAIVSFAYSQSGRRRTSIMYLKQAALVDGGAEAQ